MINKHDFYIIGYKAVGGLKKCTINRVVAAACKSWQLCINMANIAIQRHTSLSFGSNGHSCYAKGP